MLSQPPTTYSEWSSLLERAAGAPLDSGLLEALRGGTLNGTASGGRMLAERIAEFENVALKTSLKRLERNLDLMPPGTRADDIIVLFDRFMRECSDLMFFRELDCVPRDLRDELDVTITDQVMRVLGEFTRHVSRDTSPASEEVAYAIRRLRATWLKEDTRGQLQ